VDSLGNHAKVALIFAQTDPALKHRGLACFLVDTGDPGYQAQEIEHKMGLHGSDTAAIALDDVFVPDDAVLGEVGQGFKIAMSALDGGRYSVAAGCVGVCQGCLDASVAYAREREQFGRPIAGFQLVQAMLAEMRVRTDAARLLVWRAGVARDQGRDCTTEISIAKLYATEAAVWCANEAIQVHGGAGYVDDRPVERWFRDARVTTLYEGTSQIQKLIIGRALTGIDALTH
jgi:butyryl-CoA dehydrogenase